MQPTPSKTLKTQYIPTADFYSQVIDSLQDYSIFTVDNDLIINSWNSGATKIFQYEPEEIIGHHFEIIFTEADKKNNIPKSEIQTATIDGRAVDNRWHICKDGSKFFANGLVFPLTGIEGEKLGYVKILRNITEIKKSEEAISKYIKDLEELNAHKESILAILSHDLRSPLANIISIADSLKKDFDKIKPIEVKQMLHFLSDASRDELNMLDYLVEWARIKYASQTFSPVKIDLYLYVMKVFETLHPTAEANKIKLQNQIQENTMVYADGKMILSVLQNIISNALKHSHQQGKITVSSKRKEDKIIIEINDTGIGMSTEKQEIIFTPQMSSLSKARQQNKGAGIGLLLTKSLLDKNAGEIWVKSTEGTGTSFYFSLPINKPFEKINGQFKVKFAKSE